MKYLHCPFVKELIDSAIDTFSASSGGLEPPTLYLMNTKFSSGSIVLHTAPRSESPIVCVHTFIIYMNYKYHAPMYKRRNN